MPMGSSGVRDARGNTTTIIIAITNHDQTSRDGLYQTNSPKISEMSWFWEVPNTPISGSGWGQIQVQIPRFLATPLWAGSRPGSTPQNRGISGVPSLVNSRGVQGLYTLPVPEARSCTGLYTDPMGQDPGSGGGHDPPQIAVYRWSLAILARSLVPVLGHDQPRIAVYRWSLAISWLSHWHPSCWSWTN